MQGTKGEKQEEHDKIIYEDGWNHGFQSAINVLRSHFLKLEERR